MKHVCHTSDHQPFTIQDAIAFIDYRLLRLITRCLESPYVNRLIRSTVFGGASGDHQCPIYTNVIVLYTVKSLELYISLHMHLCARLISDGPFRCTLPESFLL